MVAQLRLGAGDVDEGGVLLLRLWAGRGGRGTVRAGPHLGGGGAGQRRQRPAQLQQVVGGLRLLLGPVLGRGRVGGLDCVSMNKCQSNF